MHTKNRNEAIAAINEAIRIAEEQNNEEIRYFLVKAKDTLTGGN